MLAKKELTGLSVRETGMTTTEYAVAGALVGAAIILAFSDLGEAVAAVINFIAELL